MMPIMTAMMHPQFVSSELELELEVDPEPEALLVDALDEVRGVMRVVVRVEDVEVELTYVDMPKSLHICLSELLFGLYLFTLKSDSISKESIIVIAFQAALNGGLT